MHSYSIGNKWIVMAALLMAVIGTGCDKKSNDTPVEKMVDVAKNIRFEVVEAEDADYKERPALHSGKAGQNPVEIFDLGNGVEAQVSVERVLDKQKSDERRFVTRSLSEHNYTLLAYQGGTLKGALVGNVVNNQFVPTGPNPNLVLPHGTYLFFLYRTDKVTFDQSQHQLVLLRENVDEGLFGWTNVPINQDPDQYVKFTLERRGARMRIQLEGEENFGNISATLGMRLDNLVPISITYGLTTGAEDPNYDEVSENVLFPASNFDASLNAFLSTSTYHYFLDPTPCNSLQLTFTGGEIYNQPIAGKSLIFASDEVFGKNFSYLVKVKLRHNIS